MDLPAAVQQALGESLSGVSLHRASQADENQLLRMLLLGDESGKLQVICRKGDLVDLDALNRTLGRELRQLDGHEQVRVYQRAGLKSLPALPSLTGWPTVVDERVDLLDAVALELQEPDLVMVLPADDFRVLTHKAARHRFAVDVSSIRVNRTEPEKDRDQFHAAIKKFTALRIRERLDDTLELPPLPETTQRIMQLRVNPYAVMGDLVEIVESDPSLAAQIVSWASSSFYAAAGQVKSVHDAVSRVLGFELVMNLAVGLSLGRSLKLPQEHPEGYVDYWQQAIWQAQSAGLLTGMMPRNRRPAFGLAYLAGLLHNFGYLVLAQVFPPHFRLLCRALEVNRHLDSSVTEQYLLGITREQMAACLMENWNMPEAVTRAIRHQKDPAWDGADCVYARLLWLGRQLLISRGVALGPGEPVPGQIWQQLELDPEQVAARFDELVADRSSLMAMARQMTS